MAGPFSIPYLEAEALIAAMIRVDERDTQHPVLRFFPRRARAGGKIKVRRMRRKPGQVEHTSWGGRAVPVRRGTVEETEYSPSVIKLFEVLSREDIILFVEAARAAGSNDVGPFAQSMISEANRRIEELAQNLRMDDREELHRLCCEALTGTVGYRLDGIDYTVSYGLTSIATPSTQWNSAAAKIVQNLMDAIETFRENNDRGLSPRQAFYNPKMYADYFIPNTEWQTYKKQNPELAQGFLRIPGGRTEADTLGRVTDPLFGLEWIPVEGTYVDADGASAARWDVKKLVLADMDNAMCEWGQVLDPVQTPNADYNLEIGNPQEGDDVKAHKIVLFDNGLPVIGDPQLIQPFAVQS